MYKRPDLLSPDTVYRNKKTDRGCIRRKMLYCRAQLGLSQTDVSRAVGITRAYYSNIENGLMDPSVKLACKIADVLHTDWKSIYDKSIVSGR